MEERKFLQIDALRFFAVLFVLFSHWHWFGHDIADLIHSGPRGVDLFFVISGFLITLSLIRSKEREKAPGTSLYKFYVRRFLRIFPAYYLTLFLLWFLNHSKVADGIIWYLCYASNFYIIKQQAFGGVGHLWSLAVEEQFYFVWPFLILLIPNRWLPAVISLSVLVSLSAKIYWFKLGLTFWTAYVHPLGSLDILAFGAMLAYFYHFHQERVKALLYNKAFAAFVMLQLVACLYCHFTTDYSFIYETFMRTSWGLFSTWLVGRAVFGFQGVMGSILTWRPLTYTGKISYGIYLYHVFVPGMLLGLKYPQDETLKFLLYAIVTIGIASVSWKIFESPILRLKDRFE